MFNASQANAMFGTSILECRASDAEARGQRPSHHAPRGGSLGSLAGKENQGPPATELGSGKLWARLCEAEKALREKDHEAAALRERLLEAEKALVEQRGVALESGRALAAQAAEASALRALRARLEEEAAAAGEAAAARAQREGRPAGRRSASARPSLLAARGEVAEQAKKFVRDAFSVKRYLLAELAATKAVHAATVRSLLLAGSGGSCSSEVEGSGEVEAVATQCGSDCDLVEQARPALGSSAGTSGCFVEVLTPHAAHSVHVATAPYAGVAADVMEVGATAASVALSLAVPLGEDEDVEKEDDEEGGEEAAVSVEVAAAREATRALRRTVDYEELLASAHDPEHRLLLAQNRALVCSVASLGQDIELLEAEKHALQESLGAFEENLDKAAKYSATLAGQANHKQKIQYLLHLKDENARLRTELRKARARAVQLESSRLCENLVFGALQCGPLSAGSASNAGYAGYAEATAAPRVASGEERTRSRPRAPHRQRASAVPSAAAATERALPRAAVERMRIDHEHVLALVQLAVSAAGPLPGLAAGASASAPSPAPAGGGGAEEVAALVRQLRRAASRCSVAPTRA